MNCIAEVASALVALTVAVSTAAAQASEFPADVGADSSHVGGLAYRSQTLQVSLDCMVGSKAIRISRFSRATPTDTWDRAANSFATSFTITGLTFADGAQVMYVAGITSQGHDVMERWHTRPQEGRRHLIASGLVEPVCVGGAQQPAPLILDEGIFLPNEPPSSNPSDYVGPAHRGDVPIPIRTPIFSPGASVGHIKNLVLDPEQRFLLLQVHEGPDGGKVLRLDLNEVQFPITSMDVFEELFDPVDYPVLASSDISLAVVRVVGQGRVLTMASVGSVGDGKTHIVLHHDVGNDGEWDSALTLTFEQWLNSQYPADIRYPFPDFAGGM